MGIREMVDFARRGRRAPKQIFARSETRRSESQYSLISLAGREEITPSFVVWLNGDTCPRSSVMSQSDLASYSQAGCWRVERRGPDLQREV